MAKAANSSAKKSLLSQVPKIGRDYIAVIMAERDGDLPLEKFLAKRWNFEKFTRSMGQSAKEVAQTVAEVSAQYRQIHPEWSPDQVRTVVSFSYLTMDLRECAIARRFTLDDPAELARGLSVHSRLRCLEWKIGGPGYVDFDVLLDACAVRDWTAAKELFQGERPPSQDAETLDLAALGLLAVYEKDSARLRSVVQKMAKGKPRPWVQGVCACLSGIAGKNPDQVAQGLAMILDGIQKMQQKDEFASAINVMAHGLYRFCEWISPDLVAGFDVAQGFPWDAEFHAWCQEHPDPLAGVDFTAIAPVLHRAVIEFQPPPW